MKWSFLMVAALARVLGGPLTSRLVVASFLLAGNVLLLPSNACGGTIQQFAGPTPFGDDDHSATLNPYQNDKPTPVSTITYQGFPQLTGQCTWINTGLDAFIAANPGKGWSYTWAGVDKEAKVEAGIKILDYYPYVVTRPEVTGAPGSNPTKDNPNGARVFPKGPTAEFGGAVINLQYTPQPDVPITNLHWIQAYTGTTWGVAVPPLLDNDAANPYKSQSTVSPWYAGTGYSSGTLAGGGGFFEDRPSVPEFDVYYSKQEYESNPVASIQFQVVLADFDEANKKITLYGGYWWGFTYSAVETPEPASLTLFAVGAVGAMGYAWRRRQKAA